MRAVKSWAFGGQIWSKGCCSRAALLAAVAAAAVVCKAEQPTAARSAGSPIRLNTIGYLPHATKRATIAGEADHFIVREIDSGRVVISNRLRLLHADDAAADEERLMLADFSTLQREGDYQLFVSGVGESARFRVAQDVFNWPFYCIVRAMYLWRCGCAVEARFAGDTFAHQACHLDDAYLDYVGGPQGQRKRSVGGWHDAGDYNKYTVNGAFTVGMMLQAWEHFHDRLAALRLDIPESDNEVPDFLDEVRWQLEWLLTMQADDGRVYHKLSTLQFGGFVLPARETERRYFSPWSSAATADLVAVMAQAARVFREVDKQFAQRCLAAAEKSHAFLHEHPREHQPDLTAFTTGEYDAPDADDRLWAAAELWETTGEQKYARDLEERIQAFDNRADGRAALVDADWDWGNLRNLAAR